MQVLNRWQDARTAKTDKQPSKACSLKLVFCAGWIRSPAPPAAPPLYEMLGSSPATIKSRLAVDKANFNHCWHSSTPQNMVLSSRIDRPLWLG